MIYVSQQVINSQIPIDIYCYQELPMNFIKRFLNCGCTQPNQAASNSSPILMKQKKTKPACDIGRKDAAFDGSTKTNSTSPFSTQLLVKCPVKRNIPLMNFVCLREIRYPKSQPIDLGFLIGTINYQNAVEKHLNPECMKISIGQNHELSQLRSIRANSLDSVLVCWTELDCQYSLTELLSLEQRLVLAIQTWEACLNFLKALQEELLYAFGAFPLRKTLKRLFCNLHQKQCYYFLEFTNQQIIRDNIKQLTESVSSTTISPEQFQLLLDRITLDDLANFKKNRQAEGRRIRQYLKEIELEMITTRSKVTEYPEKSYHKSEKRSQRKQAESEVFKLSEDLNEEQIKYFTSEHKKYERSRPSPIIVTPVELGLDIFHNQCEEQEDANSPQWKQSPTRTNLASPHRIRHQSEDMSGGQHYDFFDEQIFNKYQ